MIHEAEESISKDREIIEIFNAKNKLLNTLSSIQNDLNKYKLEGKVSIQT